MEEKKTNTGQGLGVAALVMGILSFVVAFIPCVGLFAIFTSIIAIVLGGVGLSQASRSDSPKGMMIGGLVIGVVALFVSIAQIAIVAGLSDKANFIGDKIEEVLEDIEKDVFEEFESGDFTITIDEGDQSIEIKGSASKKELEDKLDELEDGITIKIEADTGKKDTTGNKE